MPNKLISLLLTFCLILCLSACGTTEVGNNTNNTPPASQNSSETTQTGTENNKTSSNSEVSKENDTTQKAPADQSKPVSIANQHTHNYSNATCTSPKKCSCGATDGMALGHQFSSATCTSPQICKRCGATSGKALGHSYSAANCTSPKKCTLCGQTSGSALGHNYVNSKCSRCGKVDPDSLPVGLNKLIVIDSSRNYKYDSSSFRDTYGNIYNGAYLFGYNYSGDSYAIYNLNGKFKTFTGTIVASERLEDCAYVDYQIYADDTLVYSQSQLERTTNKISFNINVTETEKLTIKVKTYFKPGIVGSGYLGHGSIVNAQFTK